MSLIRYNANHPRALQEEIKQVFDKFFNADDADASSVVTSQWMPRVDVKEEADRFVIQADLPGVDPNEIEVQMDKGILSIKGERKTESVTEGDRYSRIERAHGVFFRRFALCILARVVHKGRPLVARDVQANGALAARVFRLVRPFIAVGHVQHNALRHFNSSRFSTSALTPRAKGRP